MTENNGKSHEISTNQMTSGEIGRNNRESPNNFELDLLVEEEHFVSFTPQIKV